MSRCRHSRPSAAPPSPPPPPARSSAHGAAPGSCLSHHSSHMRTWSSFGVMCRTDSPRSRPMARRPRIAPMNSRPATPASTSASFATASSSRARAPPQPTSLNRPSHSSAALRAPNPGPRGPSRPAMQRSHTAASPGSSGAPPGPPRRQAPTIWAARGDAPQYSAHPPAPPPAPVYPETISRTCSPASGGTGMCAAPDTPPSAPPWTVTSRIRLELAISPWMQACSRPPQSSTTTIEFSLPPVPPMLTRSTRLRAGPGPSA